LGIMLVYKTLLYKRINAYLTSANIASVRAPFTDFSTEINDFLNNMPADYNDPTAREAYNTQIKALQDKVDIMNDYLADLKTQINSKTSTNTITDQYNIQASQQVQDYRIRKLVEDIQRANDLIKESRARADSTKYKKIPVMSSCIVQEANGSVSIDTAARSSIKESASGSVISASPVLQGMVPENTQSQPAGLQFIRGTIETATPQLVPPMSQLSVKDLLETISRNGIDIRLKD
jgi:hypothetical protein